MTSTVRPEMEAQGVLERRLDEPTQDTCGADMRPRLAAHTPRRGDAD
jgi:hypothetical protein